MFRTPRRSTALLATGVLALGGLTAACEDDDADNDLNLEDDVEEVEDDIEGGVDELEEDVEGGVDELEQETEEELNEDG